MPLPPAAEQELVANPMLEQLAVALLLGAPAGAGEVFLSFFNGNTNIPGSGTQLLHSDGGWFAKSAEEAAALDEAWPFATADLVFNFSTDDVTEELGPTQLWPGTHTFDWDAVAATRGANGAVAQRTEGAAAEEAARRTTRPPVPNVLPRGAVSVRDYRLWHRGVPNTDARPRQNQADRGPHWRRDGIPDE